MSFGEDELSGETVVMFCLDRYNYGALNYLRLGTLIKAAVSRVEKPNWVRI